MEEKYVATAYRWPTGSHAGKGWTLTVDRYIGLFLAMSSSLLIGMCLPTEIFRAGLIACRHEFRYYEEGLSPPPHAYVSSDASVTSTTC
jgi:hypothetical protein